MKNQTSAAATDTPVTIVAPAAAKGVNKRTAPMTAHHLKSTKKPAAKKPAAKKPAVVKTGITNNKHNMDMKGVITSTQIAAEQGISAKTLRARIRRNIDAWEPLFKDGVKHMFADNKTTRNKIAALLS